MPKCGGKPARVVEKAIACGSVTTASVSPTRRLPRSEGRMSGRADLIMFVDTGLSRSVFMACERLCVARQWRHDRHHHLLPCGHERALPITSGARQGTDVIRNVSALLIIKATFFAQRHVAANEARHDCVHAREIHARVQAE